MDDIHILLSRIDELKSRLVSLRPLPQEAMAKIEDALDIEYTYESNRIEGNTLTLQETAVVVSEGLTISGKSMRECLEAINHKEAIDFIRDIARRKEPIRENLIKQIHSIILQQIDKKNAGCYRSVPVLISGSQHKPPQPYLVEKQMEDFMLQFDELQQREHPLIVATFLHDELVRIHPFIDGNGRTSRLLMNLYLLQHGYTMVNLKGDGNSRAKYYTALETSHVEGDSRPFRLLVAQAEEESLVRYLQIIEG